MKFNNLFEKLILEATNDKAFNKKIKYNELVKRFDIVSAEINKLNQQNELLKAEILQKHPELAKKIDKLFAKPKDAYQVSYKLGLRNKQTGEIDPKYNDIIDQYESSGIAGKLGRNIKKTYELGKELAALQISIHNLKSELGDLVDKTDEDVLNDLPASLVNALNNLKMFIQHQLEISKTIELNKAKKELESPIKTRLLNEYNSVVSAKHIPSHFDNVFYWLKMTRPELIEEIKNYTEAQCIDLIKEGITEQVAKEYSTTIDNLKDFMIKLIDTKIFKVISERQTYCENQVKTIESKDIKKEAETIFLQLKANFLDRLSQYCTKIIDAEDVIFGDDGSINAIVHAENGTFKVQTIYAGRMEHTKITF